MPAVPKDGGTARHLTQVAYAHGRHIFRPRGVCGSRRPGLDATSACAAFVGFFDFSKRRRRAAQPVYRVDALRTRAAYSILRRSRFRRRRRRAARHAELCLILHFTIVIIGQPIATAGGYSFLAGRRPRV